MSTLKDIAEKAGVSKASVSIYLRDPDTHRVGDEKKRAIDVAIETLNYRPNAIARILSESKSMTVVVIIPFKGPIFQSVFLNSILTGVQSVLFANGYSMLFLPTQGADSPTIVRNQLQMGLGYDGYILFGTRYCTMDHLSRNVKEMKELGVPFVTIEYPDMASEVNQVIFRDPPHASAVRHLLEYGHRDILLMAGREGIPDTDAGVREYRAALEMRGIAVDPSLIAYGDYERTISRSELIQRVKSGCRFTAVACLSDSMAMGVYEALAEFHLSIPDDVSVIGRHDSSFAGLLDPPLTTVRRNLTQGGERAAELLLRSIETGREGRKVFLDSELILRSSTAVRAPSGGAGTTGTGE